MYYGPFRPFRDLQNLQSELNRVFRHAHDENEVECRGSWIPSVDVRETGEAFVILAELPGMKREDIHLSIRDRILELSGEKKRTQHNEHDVLHQMETRYGNFCRKFSLSTDIDTLKINAVFKDGVLELTLPKAEQVKAKDIEIKTI
ncbi:MAG: Hsp20/alpha crystallin family protein [Calditrichaeota bacterium]|nr:MAG: Hsp20/alpha crystallin family protein [Calditrichota bacterium]